MGILQGKGIWTLYDDVDTAVNIAPRVGAEHILCKVSGRAVWNEQQAQAAISKVRRNPDLHPIAWTYMYLENVEVELYCLQRAFDAGYEAFILDAEASINGKTSQAEHFAERVAQMDVDHERIYLCVDPRLDTKINEVPMRELATIARGGLIPMVYGEIMPNDRVNAPSKLMNNAYSAYSRHQNELDYEMPLLPAFSSYWDNQGKQRMNYQELKHWCDQVEMHGPSFVSVYRAGVVDPNAWQAFRELVVEPATVPVLPFDPSSTMVQPRPRPTTPAPAADRAIVVPDGNGYSEGFYPPARPGGWSTFVDNSGFETKYRATLPNQTMYAMYQPLLPKAGRYVIEVFVPQIHATTRGAHYYVGYHLNGVAQQQEVVIDQQVYSDAWVALGIYDLDPGFPDEGRVNLIDATLDARTRELAFSTIRWRIVPTTAYGFDCPIGTPEQRAGSQVWPGHWKDSNPFKSKYDLGYHTGADLNLNYPTFDLDAHSPVSAAGEGVVTFAGPYKGSWRTLVVIRHDPHPDGRPVYTRYGHTENILVHAGERVTRGQQIASVGRFGSGDMNFHLHFDVSRSTILESQPWHWPGTHLDILLANYVDPLDFIRANRPKP